MKKDPEMLHYNDEWLMIRYIVDYRILKHMAGQPMNLGPAHCSFCLKKYTFNRYLIYNPVAMEDGGYLTSGNDIDWLRQARLILFRRYDKFYLACRSCYNKVSETCYSKHWQRRALSRRELIPSCHQCHQEYFPFTDPCVQLKGSVIAEKLHMKDPPEEVAEGFYCGCGCFLKAIEDLPRCCYCGSLISTPKAVQKYCNLECRVAAAAERRELSQSDSKIEKGLKSWMRRTSSQG